jgi:hypothetical protein
MMTTASASACGALRLNSGDQLPSARSAHYTQAHLVSSWLLACIMQMTWLSGTSLWCNGGRLHNSQPPLHTTQLQTRLGNGRSRRALLQHAAPQRNPRLLPRDVLRSLLRQHIAMQGQETQAQAVVRRASVRCRLAKHMLQCRRARLTV